VERSSEAEEETRMSQHVYTRRWTCRACHGDDMRQVLDLGTQPLANAFLKPEDLDKPELRVPLILQVCRRCGLGQLTHVVDPGVLYGPSYPYRSGYSEGWYWHCEELAAEAAFPDARVLDIGCLDGVLMKSFISRDAHVWGCDPSAPGDSSRVHRLLFGADTRFSDGALMQFDVITAQNVFGHVDNARGFLEGIAANLAPNGTAIIECPWIVDMVEKGAWDTVYHEHLSYWGVRSLARVAGAANLSVARVRHFPTLHGGTMRYYLGHKASVHVFDSSMCAAWLMEEDLAGEGWRWDKFADGAMDDIAEWTDYFRERLGVAVMGYGASAKGNTFLNALPERPNLTCIADDNPDKWGLRTPGWRFLVGGPELLLGADEILCLAGNWADQLESRVRNLGFRGEVRALWR
jgi:SAM-dependent methyltransferase